MSGKQGGKKLTLSGLYRILNDPYMYGRMVYKGEEDTLHESVPRLATEEEFWRIQELMGRRGVPRPSKYKDLPYRDIFKCATCGGSVIPYAQPRTLKSGEKVFYYYMKCTRNKCGVKCNEAQMPFAKFEEQMQTLLESLTITEEFHKWAIKWLKHDHELETLDQKQILESHHKNLKNVQSKMLNLIDMRSSNSISKEEFDTMKATYENERSEAENKIRQLNYRTDNWIESAEKLIDFALNAKEAFKVGDLYEKMTIIKFLGSNFLIHDTKVYIDLKKPFFVFQNNYEAIRDVKNRVELTETSVVDTNNTALDAQNSKWWGGWESNPHSRFFRPVP